MDLQEVGWGHGLDSYGSGERQVANSCDVVMNIVIP